MNEETMIIQPKTESPKPSQQKAPSIDEALKEAKTKKKNNNRAKTVAAGVVGAMAGSAAAAAATYFDTDDLSTDPEDDKENGDVEDAATTASDQHSDSDSQAETEAKEGSDNVSIHPHDTVPDDDDYANGGQDVQPEPDSSSDDSDDVQILGVYEREVDGVHQEMAVMTNGDEVAAVLDVDGDGEADVIAIDSDHSQSFDDNEIIDISGQHVSMEGYEQAYLAQEDGADSDGVEILAADDTDYTNNDNADVVAEDPTYDDDVQVLDVYEHDMDGVHQEMVVITDGEDVGAVIDLDGDGEGDLFAMDIDNSQTIEENEVFDISDQHLDMDVFEEAYVEQQDEMDHMNMDYADMNQNDMIDYDDPAYDASDDMDYNNDVDFYEA